MREVGGAIERINVPAIFAAGLGTRALFAEDVVLRPAFSDPRRNQLLRLTVGLGDQINIALIVNVNRLVQACRDVGGRGRNE